MADIFPGTTYAGTTLAVNRYILGGGPPDWAGQVAIQIDLNGGTCSYAFQSRVGSAGAWQAATAYPVSTNVGATSGTGSDIWMIDASGKDIAVNVTATTGSPKLYYRAIRG
jgi:hypothetical protein